MADPETLQAVLAQDDAPPAVMPTPSGDVGQLVAMVPATDSSRLADLVAYQDLAYGREYVTFVEKVRTAEEATVPGSTDLAEAVATYLYKLMAYKDEYEVARLILDETFDASVRHEFGPDAAYQVKLHPPLLRAMGLERKISFGAKARPMFRLLYAARRLRGSRLDVFGYHPVRRMERELIVQYRREVEELLPRLSPLTLGSAAEIASLPDMVRGYEQIKVQNVHRYREELTRLRDEFGESHRLDTLDRTASRPPDR